MGVGNAASRIRQHDSRAGTEVLVEGVKRRLVVRGKIIHESQPVGRGKLENAGPEIVGSGIECTAGRVKSPVACGEIEIARGITGRSAAGFPNASEATRTRRMVHANATEALRVVTDHPSPVR